MFSFWVFHRTYTHRQRKARGYGYRFSENSCSEIFGFPLTLSDDGYTGRNFNRPSFQRMIADIEAGKVKCVITKDLSRLGRNYIEAGSYMEIFFPRHNVRYIAITDGVDTREILTLITG